MSYQTAHPRYRPAPPAGRTSATRLSWGALIAFLIATMGVYTKVAVTYEGQVAVPSFPFVFIGWLLLVVNYRRLSLSILFGVLLTFGAATMFGVLAALAGASSYVSVFKGVAQLVFSITSGVGFFLFLTQQNPKSLARLSLILAIGMIIGCILELYTPFKAVSEAVRELLYSDSRLYVADRRDEFLYGAVRPKLFANEPSNVALFMAMFLISSMILGGFRLGRVVLHTVLLVIGTFLVRSPIMIFCIPVVGVYYLVAMSETGSLRKTIASALPRIFLITAVIVGGIAMMALIAYVWEADLGQNRLVRYVRNNSVFFRQIGPYFVMVDVIKAFPVSGLGIGNVQGAAPFVARVYGDYMSIDAYRMVGTLVTNNVFLHFIAFGAVGGVAMVFVYGRLLRTLGVQNLTFVLIATVLLWQSIGGYQDPRSWWVVFVTAAISVIAPRTLPRAPGPSRAPGQGPGQHMIIRPREPLRR